MCFERELKIEFRIGLESAQDPRSYDHLAIAKFEVNTNLGNLI
jgi:hypothetical protein